MANIRSLLSLVRNAEKKGAQLSLSRDDITALNAHIVKKVKARKPLTQTDMLIGKRLGKFNKPLLNEIRMSYNKAGKHIGDEGVKARLSKVREREEAAKRFHEQAMQKSAHIKKKQKALKDAKKAHSAKAASKEKKENIVSQERLLAASHDMISRVKKRVMGASKKEIGIASAIAGGAAGYAIGRNSGKPSRKRN